MPDFCAAYGCSNERSLQTRSSGITFHRFPKDGSLKRQWEVAVRRKSFVATRRSVLCSEHFKPDDFDRTGQTVRLRHGVKPSVFNFPPHLQKKLPSRTIKVSRKAEERLPVDEPQHFHEAQPSHDSNVELPSRTTKVSRKAEERLPVDEPQHFHEAQPSHDSIYVTKMLISKDHNYALPPPTVLKARLSEALARVESLEREKRNSMLRERRAKKNMHTLLKNLKEKNLINEELKDRFECLSDLWVNLLAKKGKSGNR